MNMQTVCQKDKKRVNYVIYIDFMGLDDLIFGSKKK